MNKFDKYRAESAISRVLVIAVIVLLLLITLFPFFWVIRTSLTPHNLIFPESSKMIPSQMTLKNYARVLGFISPEEAVALGGTGQKVNFLVNLKNSLIVAILTTVFQVLFCSMAGYGFARLEFPGRNKIFALILAAMMVPCIYPPA